MTACESSPCEKKNRIIRLENSENGSRCCQWQYNDQLAYGQDDSIYPSSCQWRLSLGSSKHHHLFEFLCHDLKLTCEVVIQNCNICHVYVVLCNIILTVILLVKISRGLRILMKIFKTRSSKIVKECQNYFGFYTISTLIRQKKATFLYKLVISQNKLCEFFSFVAQEKN